ncbi:MAG: GMC family oxidoreductase [Gemmatimonadetes bacterium]|uniref:GMC family oxidoreductase n=1 Tax=Candidatus Kutchimonas denitrificans TaxID=3056748 RepID=A0AAE4ZBG9_9BACT|nr:GMC family oxidoreductase [Gemmatimonadota bacterium]NIR75861.1 GMC family oxidoreductase [Candidatus Kutchimonas denitrificans]NIS02028.1 GMC family oxidoreductase [Gemmatimonadota bacterium]NIT67832.1 GMC family oxidoreductase [Gemmatimonadota bacterium]NIU53819.1 FAD-binding protein [Gemmatimonadota bacterium]
MPHDEAHRHTFESLSTLEKNELDRIMERSSAPTIPDVLGWEFRGWNLNPATKILGTRKFKKGFFLDVTTDQAWGYNVPCVQNEFDEPWVAKPSDDDPRRYFFFGVVPGSRAEKPRYRNSLIVDYNMWDEYFFANIFRFTVDYLVYPDPENRDLMLGKSYMEIGPIRFFLGYFVMERYNESEYGRQSKFLTEGQLRTVRALAEVFIEGSDEVISARDVMWNIDRQLERIDSSRKRSLKLVLFLIEHVLPRRGGWPFRRAFSKMKPAERKRFLEDRLKNPRNRGLLRDIARIRALFATGYYGDPRVHPSIGFQPVEKRPQYEPDRYRPVERPAIPLEDPTTERIQAEVCVIGSGAGGAVAAAELAAAGKDVVLLEEGPYVPYAEITHEEREMVPKLYKEGGLQSTVDVDMVILQGKCLGGSTTINNAICLDLPADVLDDWREFGARIDEPALLRSFDRVRDTIGAKPLFDAADPPGAPIAGRNAAILLDGWQRHAAENPDVRSWSNGIFVKNKDRCLGCGYCNFGCPYGRKLSTVETYLPRAARHGARIIVDCHAVEIRRKGRRATSVVCERRDGRVLNVDAEAVVVSCGAIGSSVLLMKSGIKRNVGSRFSFNAATLMVARFDGQPVNGFDGTQMNAYVDGREYLLECHFDPPMVFAGSLPGWFDAHYERMKAYPHLACAGVLIGTRPDARVQRWSLLRQLLGPVDYTMHSNDLARLKRGMARLAEVYFAAGAETVYPATFVDIPLDRDRFGSQPDELRAVIDRTVQKPDDLTLSTAHPQGGNPMSDNRSVGVVDSQFRVHGLDNLYVCDASVFSSSARVNPQLTIMAMADYFAHLGVV